MSAKATLLDLTFQKQKVTAVGISRSKLFYSFVSFHWVICKNKNSEIQRVVPVGSCNAARVSDLLKRAGPAWSLGANYNSHLALRRTVLR